MKVHIEVLENLLNEDLRKLESLHDRVSIPARTEDYIELMLKRIEKLKEDDTIKTFSFTVRRDA